MARHHDLPLAPPSPHFLDAIAFAAAVLHRSLSDTILCLGLVSPSQQSTHHHQRYCTNSSHIRYHYKTVFNIRMFISTPNPDMTIANDSIPPSLHTTATVPSIPDNKYKSISSLSLQDTKTPPTPKKHQADEVTSSFLTNRVLKQPPRSSHPISLGSPLHAAPRCGLQTPIPKSHRFDSSFHMFWSQSLGEVRASFQGR